jgi:general secretion pathway protein E
MPQVTKIATDQIPAELLSRVPIKFARQHRLLPLAEDEHSVKVAVSNVLDLSALDDLRAELGTRCDAVAASSTLVEDAINRLYERRDEIALAEAFKADEGEELQDLIVMTDEAPVIRWVNNLFYVAVRDRASDIHIEAGESEVVVRYRIDGNLYRVKTAHKGFLPSIVARVKIEASLNIAEKRLPQDGRITKTIKGKLIDVRVSTIPTAKGERIVMRLLDKEQILLDLPALGFARERLSTMEHLISRPNGIILVTGPTGSGKTTTLYSSLRCMDGNKLNISTVEDPIEYHLAAANQVQVHDKIGMSFSAALRSLLRQDPDVVMLGEIRDAETARIAVQASLTGHLVLSTLHTNDAPGSITRLINIGVEPYLISSAVNAILAQRLVRKICPQCKEEFKPGDEMKEFLEMQGLGGSTYHGKGCDRCRKTGYAGRLGIYELLVMDDTLRDLVTSNPDVTQLRKLCRERGLVTLREDGFEKAKKGLTTVDEIIRVTESAM